MPGDAPDNGNLKGLIGTSRKRVPSFGLALARRPEGSAFPRLRTQEPETLLRAVKRPEGVLAAKSTFGRARAEGKTVELVCLVEPPAEAPSKLRLYMSGAGLLPGARFRAGGDATRTGDAAAELPVAELAAVPLAERWDKARSLLMARTPAALASDPARAERLRAAWGRPRRWKRGFLRRSARGCRAICQPPPLPAMAPGANGRQEMAFRGPMRRRFGFARPPPRGRHGRGRRAARGATQGHPRFARAPLTRADTDRSHHARLFLR